jgi:hypothetical protein
LADVRTALDSWPAFAKQAGLAPSTLDQVAAGFLPL